MRRWATFSLITCCLAASGFGQTIDVKSARQPTATPSASATPPILATAEDAAAYRPILLGQGPNSLINRIDGQSLIKNGQKYGLVMFNCLVDKTGKLIVSAFYRSSPNSQLLEREVKKRLIDAV